MGTTRLRLLTLNCWLLRWGRLRVARDLVQRAEAIPDAIAATGADVVALQEVWAPELADSLVGRLRAAGFRHLVSGTPRSGPRPLGDGLLLASRHPLGAPERLTFRRRSVWYERLIAKGALAADVGLPEGARVRVVTAHLGVVRYDAGAGAFRSRDEDARAAQLRELAAWRAAASPGPLVLAGDLNLADRPFEAGRYRGGEPAPYRALLDGLGLRDAFREAEPHAPGFTFDPATNAYAARGRCRFIPGQRIDYVLFRNDGGGLMLEGAAVVFRDPPLLSDHYGVLADFRLGPKISASSAGGVTSS